jgi:hypothetical protein
VDSEQAAFAEQSDAASKRRLLDGIIDVLQKLAERSRKRRRRIREKIKALGLFPDDADQPPNAAVQLSNPAFRDMLPFPFIGPAVPTRFRPNVDSENTWFYAGREMFMRLLDRLRHMQKSRDCSTLWVYGTDGYGKSRLLAALVCYLAAQEEPVVYIPDCLECLKSPAEYVQAAMLFAWADDKTIQDEIITLDTQEKIRRFFEYHPNAIFFIDHVNACEGWEWESHQTRSEKREVKRWLDSCRVRHTTILSTSEQYLETSPNQSTEEIIHVLGGFTKVSLSKE